MHARSFEQLQIWDFETPIPGPGRDDGGAGAHPFVVDERQNVAVESRLDLEAGCLVRDSHFDTELLRLGVGARHQRHAAYSGREAHVVLDARGCASLTAE